MKILIKAAAVTLTAASAAHAQQAVQWKVSDGGNGHWYAVDLQFRLWADAKAHAESIGGFLATTTSGSELSVIRPLIESTLGVDYWLGASRTTSSGPWLWVTGEPFDATFWEPGAPDNGPESICLEVIGRPESPGFGLWNDEAFFAWGGGNYSVIEWSADCNGDGIVDHGQCRDGSLPDYNGNNVPDCCEQGAPCVVGSYPVQWRAGDGGNGHWYRVIVEPEGLNQLQASQRAAANGAHLFTGCSTEFDFAISNTTALDPAGWRAWGNHRLGPWIGLVRTNGSFGWITADTDCDFDRWDLSGGQPDSQGEIAVMLYSMTPQLIPLCHDVAPDRVTQSALLEWSADCNGDGVVDYGQILQHQLADTNQDGIPDICQPPTCADADIYRDFNVNGADLGILLSQWGPNTPLTESDLNSDGMVNGADLGILLSFWGACP